MTGHTLAVCASAVFLGRTAATVGSALYAVAALAGLPVYTGWRRGVHKPTIGYVVGFSACAWLVGSGKNKPLAVFVRCCVGQFATLLIGSTWLIFPGYAETLPAAWTLGVRPVPRRRARQSVPRRVGGRAWVVDAVADVARGQVGARSPHAAHILAHHLLGTGAEVDRVDRRDDGRGRLGLGAWWGY